MKVFELLEGYQLHRRDLLGYNQEETLSKYLLQMSLSLVFGSDAPSKAAVPKL